MAYGYNAVDEEEDAKQQSSQSAPPPKLAPAMPAGGGAPMGQRPPPSQTQGPAQGTGFTNLSKLMGLHQGHIQKQNAAWDATGQKLQQDAQGAMARAYQAATRPDMPENPNQPNLYMGKNNPAYRAEQALGAYDSFHQNRAGGFGMSGMDQQLFGASNQRSAPNLRAMFDQQMGNAARVKEVNTHIQEQRQAEERAAAKARQEAQHAREVGETQRREAYDKLIASLLAQEEAKYQAAQNARREGGGGYYQKKTREEILAEHPFDLFSYGT